MQLFKFQANVGSSEAYAIKAKNLDDNFSKLTPKSNGTYGINEELDGWSFNIFPALPRTISLPVCLAYNGKKAGTPSAPIQTSQVGMQWVPVAAGIMSTTGITANAHLTATGKGQAVWAYPPYGEPKWREVERCDGKKMWVWGTDWE